MSASFRNCITNYIGASRRHIVLRQITRRHITCRSFYKLLYLIFPQVTLSLSFNSSYSYLGKIINTILNNVLRIKDLCHTIVLRAQSLYYYYYNGGYFTGQQRCFNPSDIFDTSVAIARINKYFSFLLLCSFFALLHVTFLSSYNVEGTCLLYRGVRGILHLYTVEDWFTLSNFCDRRRNFAYMQALVLKYLQEIFDGTDHTSC